MAEGIARSLVEDQDFFVASAGVAAVDGMPVSAQSIRSLDAMGIEFKGRSKRLTTEMIRGAELVLCMTAAHRDAALELAGGDPTLEAKIQRLDPDGDVPDPIGQGQDRYDEVAARLRAVIPSRLAALISAS